MDVLKDRDSAPVLTYEGEMRRPRKLLRFPDQR